MTQRKNVYETITEQIIHSLESGVVPWARPWEASQYGIHRNAATDRPYRGLNILLLNMIAMMQGFVDPRWLTFRNAEKLGGHVKKGEKGVGIIFWKFVPTKADGSSVSLSDTANDMHPVSDDENQKVIPLVRMYTVFNVEQCEGLNIADLEVKEIDNSTYPDSELILNLPIIKHGGNKAYYTQAKDFIAMPTRDCFESPEFYYSTAFHEIVHWTGHHSRLHRKFGKRFGDNEYAVEELVAEIGSAFIGAGAGLPFEDMRHPEYINSWLQILKKDSMAIFTAAAKAQTAADFVLDKAGLSFSEGDQLPAAA